MVYLDASYGVPGHKHIKSSTASHSLGAVRNLHLVLDTEISMNTWIHEGVRSIEEYTLGDCTT